MSKSDKDSISAAASLLEQHGVEFVVDGNFSIGANDLSDYIDNPDLYMARYYGVNIGDYRDNRDGVMPRCSALTVKGRQCSNTVLGAHHGLRVEQYVRLKGGYCAVHGGTRSEPE